MPDKHITFGGDQIPAYIAETPKRIKPKRKMTVSQIPGTNREIVVMEDAWETYDQPYKLFIGDGSDNCVIPAIDQVTEKLYKTGWQTLLDDYDPDYYRLAYFEGPYDIEDRYTKLGVFEINFKCRAERFLLTGETPVNITSGDTLNNPTDYDAKPLIHIEGQGSGTLTVAGTTMSFTGIVDYLNIDCDIMDVYRLPTENRNNLMTGEFPVLKPGSNSISFTGGINTVTITPKWFII